MNYSGNSFEDKTSDDNIRKFIKNAMDDLKNNPLKYEAIFPNGEKMVFEKYEDAIAFLSSNPSCKVVVV